MNTKVLLAVSGALIGVAVSSCGGGGNGYGDNGNVAVGGGSSGAAATEPQTLSVAEVVALAQQSSETAEPFAVVAGQTTITPTDDETSDPATI